MTRAIHITVAALLLMVQGLVAFAPGRVLCIPIADCGTHESIVESACDHCEPDDCTSSETEETDGSSSDPMSSGPMNAALCLMPECGCHVHLPVPRGEQTSPTLRDDSQQRALFVPVLVAMIPSEDWSDRCGVSASAHSPGVRGSAQLRALKTTRLRI